MSLMTFLFQVREEVLSSEITLFPKGIYVKCQAFARKGLDILVDVI